MHNLFVVIPSVRGIHPLTMWNVFEWRTVLEHAGHRLHGSSVYRMPLDLARNELATVYLSTTCDLVMLLDDDVQVEPQDILKMIEAIDAGCDIVTAPCRTRLEGGLFNILPIAAPAWVGDDVFGSWVAECEWTGLGAVMVKRHVLETLHAKATGGDAPGDLKLYRSTVMPDKLSATIFRTVIVPAKRYFPDEPSDVNIHMLDDRAFSHHAREAGFKIHAAIEVRTVHDGMIGCFAVELEKMQAQEAQRKMPSKTIVGADGKPIAR